MQRFPGLRSTWKYNILVFCLSFRIFVRSGRQRHKQSFTAFDDTNTMNLYGVIDCHINKCPYIAVWKWNRPTGNFVFVLRLYFFLWCRWFFPLCCLHFGQNLTGFQINRIIVYAQGSRIVISIKNSIQNRILSRQIKRILILHFTVNPNIRVNFLEHLKFRAY